MKTLLVIDGNSILNRAFYGIRPLSTKTGLPTNAVYGFITILKKHIDALAPDRILCAFDRKAPTFRHKMYDGYKATRKGMPEELAMQLPYAKEVAAAMGCCVVSMDGYEADDILGTASAMAETAGDMHTFILTGDRDSLQLVSEKTTVVLVKTKEDILYTPDVFRAEYGITPAQFVDVKALMGDISDNIPGVPGIGEKTALKLIGQAGSLDAVYANLDGLGLTKSVTEKLRTGEESAHLSRRLAEIFRAVPMETCLICTDCTQDRAKLNELFTELEFTALKSRFSLTDDDTAPVQATEEIPAFIPLAEAGSLPAEEPIVCALTENGALAAVIGDTHVIIPADSVKDVLDAHPVVCHDYKKLYAALTERGITPQCIFDTMLAAYLLSPGEGNYPLTRVVPQHIGCEITEFTPEAEAHFTARLYPILKEELDRHGMTDLLCEIEIPLAEVLAEMETAGFTLDADGLHEYITALQIAAEDLAQTIYEEAGAPFNINSPKQLGEVLFEKLGLPPSKKTQRGYSTDAETLEKLRPYHPIIGHILDYRQLVKLTGTYGDNLIALRGADGKIHSRFNQTGTATGRLSSTDPNMQNIPVRGQLGRELRRYFTATDEGHILLDADYSQIELRLLAILSGDKAMQHAFLTGEDIHRATASQVFRTPIEEVTPELRSRAKAVNFGIVYGIGEYSLSQDLGISRARAGEYIRSYLDTYPDVERYLDETVEAAKRDGYTTTMFARKRFIPELSSQNKNIRAFGERVAKNSPIQGTAADIIKIAMIRTRDALREAGIDAKLILQVHDELIVEVAKRDQAAAAEILGREMEGAVSLAVPLTAEVSAGENWFEAKQ
ncbi:MAG: DNA polymerase I [Clostridia bacterium]|nr:DNA polymerase I [Clostridia bacterium]